VGGSTNFPVGFGFGGGGSGIPSAVRAPLGGFGFGGGGRGIPSAVRVPVGGFGLGGGGSGIPSAHNGDPCNPGQLASRLTLLAMVGSIRVTDNARLKTKLRFFMRLPPSAKFAERSATAAFRGKKFCLRNAEPQSQARRSRMLDNLRIHSQIVYDLTVRDLEPLSGSFERLAYLAGLRDVATGEYSHPYLCTVYNPGRVHEVLFKCHEELFERLLESTLAEQQEDLLKFVESLTGDTHVRVQYCLQNSESWIPLQAPDYLKQLFRSNQTVLAELLLKQKPTAGLDS
jgi:hypothetical protein